MNNLLVSSDQAHEMASCATGLNDFGGNSDNYLHALNVLIESVRSDASLTPMGEQLFAQSLAGCLVGRLMAAKGFSDFPDAVKQKIEKPIIITGFTRSGTTALHRLIASMPNTQSLEYWLANFPMPRPPRDLWESLEPFKQTRAGLDALYALAPDIPKIHDMRAEKPDECRLILAQSFMTYALMGFFWAPSYGDWLMSADRDGSYQRYADVLRLIGFRNNARWILKCPMHIYSIDSLLKIFPDACIIHTCREPTDAMASVCSLMRTVAEPFQKMPEKRVFGRRVFEDYAVQMDRFMELRKKLNPRRFLDVRYTDFVADPVGTAIRALEHFEMAPNDEALSSLQRWTNQNEQHQLGKHEYTAEEYGLGATHVNDRLAVYREVYLGE